MVTLLLTKEVLTKEVLTKRVLTGLVLTALTLTGLTLTGLVLTALVFNTMAFSGQAFAGQEQGEFDPERLSRSTVKVLIKNKHGITAAATGFLWRNNKQVVTSLHVLSADPSSKIIIEFGKKKRLAKIKSVLLNADLVLLEVNKPVEGWYR